MFIFYAISSVHSVKKSMNLGALALPDHAFSYAISSVNSLMNQWTSEGPGVVSFVCDVLLCVRVVSVIRYACGGQDH
jgi:hypothetical protein